MQKIFTEYRQPFALTYLWISLMVVYLPISILRDFIYKLLDRKWNKDIYDNNSLSTSLAELNIPLRVNETQDDSEAALKSYLMTDMSFSETEAGLPLLFKDKENEFHNLEETRELSLKEIVTCSLYLAPVWFITEVFFSAFCVCLLILMCIRKQQ